MREKYKFTRQAAYPNRSGMAVPPFLTVENVICDLTPVVEQFSQIMVKSNNHIWSQSGQLFSINQTGKERHDP
ncbi:hypothetical protein [Halobacillus amylolyticus]|uniref:Uncharacterized protein n=1 Tax=Halobacillus amylolyticus TaxID=2932259 RepID=A0ABY4HB68_9BACI|nr:hypothetical protein [Halobacillus amylolyticus]UOR11638.1 hypothetical protein MUO15_18990 [Halobacillus amylolyticus]